VELFLIRHGQSANNILEDISRRSEDPELTKLGEKQAVRVAEHLAAGGHLCPAEREEGRLFLERVYCSPMIRALQTAAAIGRGLGAAPEVWVDIHEVGGIFLDHGGERGIVGYPGQRRSQIAARFPEFRLPDEIGEDGWWRGSMETFHAGQGRAIGVAGVLRKRAAEDSRIALISHGGFMSCLLQALGRQLPAEGYFYAHGNTAITRLRLQEDGMMIVSYINRLEHLPEELIS